VASERVWSSIGNSVSGLHRHGMFIVYFGLICPIKTIIMRRIARPGSPGLRLENRSRDRSSYKTPSSMPIYRSGD
jgi:hypothetical protein